MFKLRKYCVIAIIVSFSFICAEVTTKQGIMHQDIANGKIRTFKAIKPTPLTDEEEKKDVIKRIKEKFIGDIPPHILDAIFYFHDYEKGIDEGLDIMNRILLSGESGMGKSYLIEVMAQELQLPYISISAASFLGEHGESSREIREIFEFVEKQKQAYIIFIDEIDAIGSKRKESTHDENRGTLITLLTEIQRLSKNENIFIAVATNDLESLDEAVKDRFNAICSVKGLNHEQRKTLIMKLFNDKHLPADDELAQRLAYATERYEYSYVPDSEKHVHPSYQKEDTQEYVYSNRKLEHIVVAAHLRRARKKDDKSLCEYFGEIMNEMGLPDRNARGKRSINCDNLNK